MEVAYRLTNITFSTEANRTQEIVFTPINGNFYVESVSNCIVYQNDRTIDVTHGYSFYSSFKICPYADNWEVKCYNVFGGTVN